MDFDVHLLSIMYERLFYNGFGFLTNIFPEELTTYNSQSVQWPISRSTLYEPIIVSDLTSLNRREQRSSTGYYNSEYGVTEPLLKGVVPLEAILQKRKTTFSVLHQRTYIVNLFQQNSVMVFIFDEWRLFRQQSRHFQSRIAFQWVMSTLFLGYIIPSCS